MAQISPEQLRPALHCRRPLRQELPHGRPGGLEGAAVLAGGDVPALGRYHVGQVAGGETLSCTAPVSNTGSTVVSCLLTQNVCRTVLEKIVDEAALIRLIQL